MQPTVEAWSEGSDFNKCIVGDSDLIPTLHGMCSSSETSAEAKSAAASNNHKEAEKRRRQRINSHLDTLRTLLPCNSKTDKASLLAKVVEQVKELKQQSSHIMQLESSFPSDTDDVIVVTDFFFSNNHQSLVIKASFCCDDRSDLISELIQTLKSLRLSPLKAEMVTFGGRTRNVLILATDEIDEKNEVVEFLREELRSLVHRSSCHLGDRFKRQRRLIK
ncbi:transcription factor bHLH106 [Heracleum sosnowskyi]|uniref:Transcription factor bHLH106 n=1 Tax=Heracleum sosnowskyi TaxID=360622 RepID=A0AAD8IK98_9APIA|nr:transcription factor bHLH106 [Heracleum sosnowskyi]